MAGLVEQQRRILTRFRGGLISFSLLDGGIRSGNWRTILDKG